MIKPIDFDGYFREYIENWIAENAGSAKNYDELEARLPEVQLKFLNTPADWLNGEKPGMYFQKMGDAEELVDLIAAYEEEDLSVPDALLERVAELKEASIAPLIRMAEAENSPEGVRITALNLLIEIGSEAAWPLCLSLIRRREDDDPLADVAAELLRGAGKDAVSEIIEELSGAGDEALLTFLDLLCNYPGDERIYTYTARQFKERPDQRIYYASYLARLNDERALPLLMEAIEETDISYLDYIEMRNAIESLGGEVEDDRSFAGDPYYESLRRMDG